MQKNFYRAQILIIDDSPESIEIAASVLQKIDYQVRVAINTTIAMQLLKIQKPNLILLDINMPDMDGFNFYRKLQTIKEYNNIPVIFLTASDDEYSIQKAFSLGARDYITKPFKINELLARVNTQIKLLQQETALQKAYNELNSFCDSVAHDLKAPLISISQLANILQDDYQSILPDDGKNLLQIIEEKSLEVISIMTHLLEFSRASKASIIKKEINFRQCCYTIFREINQSLPTRQIKFNLDNLPNVWGDELLLKQVLRNIISNAVKYTSHKKIALIDFTYTENNKEYIFCCKDNGIGFSMKQYHRLFHIFERLHPTEEFNGNGVGLVICQRILQRHGGKIWLESEVNVGTKCFFTLPKNK